MIERTNYDFRVTVPCAVPGTPRPVGLAARMAKIIADALTADGFQIHHNALPHGVGVECTNMEYVEIDVAEILDGEGEPSG